MSTNSATARVVSGADGTRPTGTWRCCFREHLTWSLLTLIVLTTWLLLHHLFGLSDDLYRELASRGTGLQAQTIEEFRQLFSNEVEKAQSRLHETFALVMISYTLGVIGVGLVVLTLRRTTRKLRGAEVSTRAMIAHFEASQQKLEAIINSVDGIVWEADAQTFQFTFVSKKAEQILGYSAGRWISEPTFWQDHLHPEDRTWAVDYCAQATRELRPHEFEYRMLAADGREVWVNDIVAVISEHGRPVKLRGLIVDITESKRAAAAVRESEARLQVAVQASNLGPWDWNLVTDEVHFSPEWKRQLGYADEEIEGQFSEFVSRLHPDDHDRIMSAVQAYIADPSVGYDVEFRMRHKDGSYRWIHTRATILFDAVGKPIRMLGCHCDITVRKGDEAELESLHQRLVNTSRQAGMAEIATNVLHNVGNVLNSVNVSATLVMDGLRKSKASGLARVVELLKQHEGDLGPFMATDARGKQLPAYLAQLSEHLLAEQAATVNELDSLQRNISHIKEIVAMQQNYAKVSGVKEIVNVCDLAEDSLRMNAGALKRHGVEIVREFEAVPLINVDKHKVLQILVNLVRNAKYACDESGRDEKLVKVRVVNVDGWIEVSVIDNGVGIPRENLTRIFNHGFTTRESGHGFGLHSGALAAKEMGGSLTVRSDGPDQGARFMLRLPVPHAPETPIQESDSSGTIQTSEIRVASVAQLPRLLIVLATSLLTLSFAGPAFALDPAKSVFQFNCQNWTRQSGLSADKINAVTQTKDGYLWLGTQNGLVRFDGLDFKVVSIDLPEARGQNVWSLSRTKAGGMLFAIHEGGFGAHDGHTFATIGDERWNQPGVEANMILEARDGTVWTGSNFGIGHWDKGLPGEDLFNQASHGLVTTLCEDSESRIWFGTVERGLFHWKAGKQTQVLDETLRKCIIFSLASDSQGRIWVGTNVDLRCFDSNGQAREIPPFPIGVRALLVDTHGVLWVGTMGQGLARYQNGEFAFFKKSDGLASDHVNSLFEDVEGSLWIGTRDGLSQMTDLKFPIYSDREGLIPGSNLSVAPSNRGGVWITTSKGISHFDGQTARNYSNDLPLSNYYVKRGFEARNGDVYLVDGDKNIDVISGSTVLKVYPNTEWPVAFAEDAVSILVSIGGSLFRIHDGRIHPFEYNEGQEPVYYWINNLLVASDGAIWVASANGLIRVKDRNSTRWSTEDGLHGNKVYSICEDQEGVIWAGSPAGIARIKDGRLNMIRQKDGLHDDRIYAIVPDDFESFWCASGHGFFRVTRRSLNDFANGNSKRVQCEVFDGLESIKFIDRTDQEYSGCKSSDGRIWFPNPQGVVMIDPARIVTNPIAPPVHVGLIRANGREISGKENAVVSPGNGELEFHFTALSFIAPHKLQFRYQLEGYDKDWVDAGERRMAYYTNLRPRKYIFRVIAANADGVWNAEGASFTIQLQPHFYQATWFTILCAGGLCALLVGSYAWRVRQVNLKQQALQQSRDLLEAEVLGRTSELAEANSSLKQSVEDHMRIGSQLERRTQSLEEEIEKRKRMQLEVERVHQQLLDASRQAGMAEIATNVLHNVGNVLNSVNISAGVVAEKMRKSKATSLTRVAAMLKEHENDLGSFLTTDVKGQQLPSYLTQLAEHLLNERDVTVKELELLRGNIDHIKHIVSMQQNYAKVSGIKELLNVVELVEDSLRLNLGSLSHHGVDVVREFESVPELNLDKHKILQILVNLIRNAKHACDESGRCDKRLTLRVRQGGDGISISVIDNGVGIPPENLTRIFNHGFTTRATGHGFGLHSCSLAAMEMGGSLMAHSDGVGQGATFTLKLPLSRSESAHES